MSNITRHGTLEDSLREYETAVERAGGSVDEIRFDDKSGVERRFFYAEDGVLFQHRVESQTGPTTVDIHIEKPQTRERGTQRPDQIKIRFEAPEESEGAGAPAEGPEND